MSSDENGLPSTVMYQESRVTSDELTQDFISNIESYKIVHETTDDVEIDEYFKLRIQTYKCWASCIYKKSCTGILIDAFKSDLINDFTLMINWLATTDEESRVILDWNFDVNETMDLDGALNMLYHMGIPQKRLRGPTIDAFRELIAVLCGGVRGQIPFLDSFADFTETAHFSDEKESEVIVEIVKEIFNPSSNETTMGLCNATPLEIQDSPEEDMLYADVPLASSTVELDDENGCSKVEEPSVSSSRIEEARLEGSSVSNRSIEEEEETLEGPSVSNASVEETSVGDVEKSQFGYSPLKSSPVIKPRREIFPIKSRKVGKMGMSSTSEDCFICGKNGDLIVCGKKYASGSFCTTKFHEKCIQDYNAAEYSVNCLRKIVYKIICPLHFCSTCYLERWKTTSVRGQLVECDSCFRSFHVECCPAGFQVYQDFVPVRTKEGNILKVKQAFTRCHSHCDTNAIPLVENKYSHLPFCNECEVIGEETLLRCSQCVRSFHASCLTLIYRDQHGSNTMNSSLCESCMLGETLRVGQAVIAKFRTSFYAATITKLEDYPKRCIKIDKYGKYFNQPGYLSVKWAGCDNLYQLLPARCVVPMFSGSYELIGKRVKEDSYRAAWEEMEQDLSIPRPTFDYIPEKYIKIKTSVYHPSCPKPRLVGCEESDGMCDCPATDSGRCGPDSKCANRAVLQECPEACEAIGNGCNNRGISRREVNPHIVIREAPGKGMGAFAVQDIPKGSFIAEYAGEIISTKEMNRRIAEITAHRNAEEKHYMMALDAQRIIDCKEKGNNASPNCKVETVHAVVSKTKQRNGVYLKYDKRITIYTTEDVPAGTELCFNYQMRQYSVGCPLPDCKCGAENCTGTLGLPTGSAPDKVESDVFTADIVKQRRNKPVSRNVIAEEPPKKKKHAVAKRRPVADTAPSSSLNSASLVKDEKPIMNHRPIVVFKKVFNSSKSELHVRDTPSPLRRSTNRRSKPFNGLKEEAYENVVDEKLLTRALLKGAALEAFPNSIISKKLENNQGIIAKVNGLRRTRRIAELAPSNGTMEAE